MTLGTTAISLSPWGEALPQVVLGADRRRNFGFLEHLCETRFGVPKITLFGNAQLTGALQNKLVWRDWCSKNRRIRA